MSLSQRMIEAFAGEMTPKFLSTASADGEPNIAPIISMEAWNERELIFGELMIWKTKKNLLANPKAGAAVFTKEMNCWTARGDFVGFERTGDKHDKLNMKDMFRYNAYTGLRSAGTIHVVEAQRVRGMMSASRLAELAVSSRKARDIEHGHTGPMPPQVTEKFANMKAAKFVSYIDSDGYPVALPALSLFPTGHDRMTVGYGALRSGEIDPPSPPFRIAACIITFDPVAYQVKGTVTEYKKTLGIRTAVIRIEEVYSSSPPLPGKRIDRAGKTARQ